MKKLHMGQNVWIAGLAVFTLFFAVLSVLSLIPRATTVKISQEITVSSFEVSASPLTYRVFAEGSLRNTTDEEIVIERLVVPVRSDADRDAQPLELAQENIRIPPRTEVTVTLQGEGGADYRLVGDVTAVTDGKEIFLRNPADVALSAILIPLTVTAIGAWFLVRACRVRYLMAVEDRMVSDTQT